MLTKADLDEIEERAAALGFRGGDEGQLLDDLGTVINALKEREFGPWRNHMETPEWYAGIDAGIRFAVRVLHNDQIGTCQSCEGGPGHAYEYPTVDIPSNGEDAVGFRAMALLHGYGIQVVRVSQVWSVMHGRPDASVWRIEIARPLHDRADEPLIFENAYRAIG